MKKRGRPSKNKTDFENPSKVVIPPKKQKMIIDWLLDGHGAYLDMGKKGKVFYTYYAQIKSDYAQSLSLDELITVLPSNMIISRATLARIVKGIRDDEYDDYIQYHCKEKNIDIKSLNPKVIVNQGSYHDGSIMGKKKSG